MQGRQDGSWVFSTGRFFSLISSSRAKKQASKSMEQVGGTPFFRPSFFLDIYVP
jgi:hypothetical protein